MTKCTHCKQEYPQSSLKAVRRKAVGGKAIQGETAQSKAVGGKAIQGETAQSKAVGGEAISSEAVENKVMESKAIPSEAVANEGGETLYFCCNGCELAYTLLQECNLESFYTKLGENTLNTKAMQDSKSVAMNFSSINFEQKYLKDRDGYKEVHFVIEGVVCAACVWLNEQILSKLKGIEEIKINYTTHKAKILFDPTIINFQEIYDHIAKIGYKAIVYDPKDKEQQDSVRNRTYYVKLVVALFCAMNVMWVNVGQYSGFFVGIDSVSSSILNLASFLLATPVLFFCASDFYKQAYRGIQNGVIGMDLLVITGTSLVYCYSIYAWLSGSGHTYFESVCMIILFVLGAKFLESLSQKTANDNLCKMNAILPLEARTKDGAIISVSDIAIDDILLVLPGEMLPVDGVLLSESCVLDYANISGESENITKQCNEIIMAGAIALEKPLLYKAQKSFEDSSMSKLARLLKESEFSTPRIATTAFKIAGQFSRIVLSIAALGFCYHYFIGQSGFEYALLIAVSVIVIACPCALALATPIASVVGLNVGFKHHIIYTKADFLESLAKSDCVVFDKTGTLTEGAMRVSRFIKYENLYNASKDNTESLDENERGLLALLLGHNPHNIAKALLAFIAHDESKIHVIDHFNTDTLRDFCLIAGKGFEVRYKEGKIIGGSKAYMQEHGIEIQDCKEYENATQCFIAYECANKEYRLAYAFYLQDCIKEHAKELICLLQQYKKDIIMLSGDRESVVQHVAKTLNISSYKHSQTPLQKAEFIQEIIAKGGQVVMVGDGLNDSLALKYAQVGIAMGSGSEIALQYSDVIILDDSLQSLKKAFRIAHKTLRAIHQNLIMSLVYNTCAIPFALCGFVIPLFAAAFMSLSSLCVVLNSMRLTKNKL